MLNEKDGYPLSPLAVNPQGNFQDRFAIPAAVLEIVARVRTVDVSIAPVSDIEDIVRQAIDEQALVLEKPGETVLAGDVSRAPADAEQAG